MASHGLRLLLAASIVNGMGDPKTLPVRERIALINNASQERQKRPQRQEEGSPPKPPTEVFVTKHNGPQEDTSTPPQEEDSPPKPPTEAIVNEGGMKPKLSEKFMRKVRGIDYKLSSMIHGAGSKGIESRRKAESRRKVIEILHDVNPKISFDDEFRHVLPNQWETAFSRLGSESVLEWKAVTEISLKLAEKGPKAFQYLAQSIQEDFDEQRYFFNSVFCHCTYNEKVQLSRGFNERSRDDGLFSMLDKSLKPLDVTKWTEDLSVHLDQVDDPAGFVKEFSEIEGPAMNPRWIDIRRDQGADKFVDTYEVGDLLFEPYSFTLPNVIKVLREVKIYDTDKKITPQELYDFLAIIEAKLEAARSSTESDDEYTLFDR